MLHFHKDTFNCVPPMLYVDIWRGHRFMRGGATVFWGATGGLGGHRWPLTKKDIPIYIYIYIYPMLFFKWSCTLWRQFCEVICLPYMDNIMRATVSTTDRILSCEKNTKVMNVSWNTFCPTRLNYLTDICEISLCQTNYPLPGQHIYPGANNICNVALILWYVAIAQMI